MHGQRQCTAETGNLLLILAVSDSISLPGLLLTSGVQVLQRSEPVYASGFEDPTDLTCNAFP